MDHFWLLVAVSGLVATTVIGQSESDFGNAPPLPATGMLLVHCNMTHLRLLTIPCNLNSFSSPLFQWMCVCGSAKTKIQLRLLPLYITIA